MIRSTCDMEIMPMDSVFVVDVFGGGQEAAVGGATPPMAMSGEAPGGPPMPAGAGQEANAAGNGGGGAPPSMSMQAGGPEGAPMPMPMLASR
mmetsp:Transcript_42907/g.133993  ORF Transcript_42907/g.133993 Transcript_42907/m.133993 type:complete len:92 (-) Transcript_42907:1221-1496(-)